MASATWALAGGAIGSILTMVAGLGVRASSVPREVRRNDRLAQDRDEQLVVWVCDETVALYWQLHQIRGALSARGALRSGEYAFQIKGAKDGSLHRYRDEEHLVRREVAQIFDHEGWLHDVWRWARRRARYAPTASACVVDVINAWRSPPAADQLGGSSHPPFDEPTQRTLHATIEYVRANPGAFQ